MTSEKNSASNNQRLVAGLSRFASFDELRRSDFYGREKSELERLLGEPHIYETAGAEPRLRSFLRVVEWNIERGARLPAIIDALTTHPVLRYGDLLLVNELDVGMLRSGNRDIPRELAAALGAHAIYGAEYLELTKGVGAELELEGENTTALHGNAILTRYAFFDPRIVRLPRCEKNFESTEKRLGGRLAIIISLEAGGPPLIAATTHLDVVNTPSCRGKQMRSFLQAVKDYGAARYGNNAGSVRAIAGGDLNTHTFARGGRLRALRNTAKVLLSDPEKLARQLLDPQSREPALAEFARFGYDLTGFNDRSPTSRTIVSDLNDATRLPAPVRWWATRRIGPQGLLLEFRLDWLAAQGLQALKAGEAIDRHSGVVSVEAQTIRGLSDNGSPISDHDPIVVDVAL